MPTIALKDLQNQTLGSVELPEAVFGYPFKKHLVHQAVRNRRAALRAGTHKTKVRSEVSGSNKKPFKQKGTGRARQGGARPPIHRHGGTVFGPVPRDYNFKMNVKEKKNALKAALSSKVRDERLILLSDLDVAAPKTRLLEEALIGIGVEGKVLVIESMENVNAYLASRNNPRSLMVDPLHVNVYDVLNCRWIVATESSLQMLTEVLAS